MTLVVLLGFGSLALLAAFVARERPAVDREWRSEQAVLPRVSFDGDVVHVRNVRDFRHHPHGEPTPGYADRSYDLGRIERVWFVISPFSRAWRGPAHSFVTFGFADSQYVSVSVEARREVGEEYSIWKGALRRFELMYVIGDERDLIGLRAVAWNDPVYLYPIRATREQVRELFVSMLRRAEALAERPEFYNTLTNNCTTNILDAVNAIAAQRIPYGVEIFLPGYADRLAHRRGLIDSELSLELARERFRINERAAAAAGAADFSQRIRGS